MNNEFVFAFDVGKASLGICVRTDDEILELDSLIIPEDFAMTSDFRSRRRSQRTRLAHKKREEWLKKTWYEAGLEVIPLSDERMQREFPKKGDNTLYNSAALRVALIQGKPLAPWQIFKALWSSIQLRGYDANIPWGRHYIAEENDQQSKDEKENQESAQRFRERLQEAISPHFEYEYPCFLAASMMGLWSPDNPQEVRLRIDHTAQKVRRKPGALSEIDPGNVAPRELVAKEIRTLIENAKKQLPHLSVINTNVFLYGEAEKEYASYKDSKYFSKRGTEWDARGVLSQKIPRFDNRIIGKCQLMPTRNVCKAKEPLYKDFTLLMKIKNLRFTDANGEYNRGLRLDEFKKVFELLKENLDSKISNELTFGIIKKAVEKAISMKTYDFNMGEKDKFKINTGGRSRFCRPALRLMVDILLAGQNPSEFDISPYIQDSSVMNPIQRPELEKAVSRLGETWEKIHVGDDRNNEIIQSTYEDRKNVIIKIIGNINNPIVRHRLVIFYNHLQRLTHRHCKQNQPDYVVLEFIRGSKGLEGQKTAKDWDKFIKDNENKNQELRDDLEKLGYEITKRNIDKLKLLREQGSICLYTGNPLAETQLHLYQIDHIVPISLDLSSDAIYNKVVCVTEANNAKTNKTPFEWLHDKPEWETYTERIRNTKTLISKKRQLLLSKNARELVENYNGLAETAYIARVAQQIVSLHFGWGLQTKGDNRRVFVSNGRETAKIRSVYKLNELLLSLQEREGLKLDEKIKKNRSNPKHHALDAYCISYSRKLTHKRKANGDICWEVPNLMKTKNQLESKIKELFPNSIRRNGKELYPLETIYGYKIRTNQQGKVFYYLTVRKNLVELLGNKRDSLKKIWDEDIKTDLEEKSKNTPTKEDWLKLLSSYKHPKRKVPVKRVLIIETTQDAPPVIDSSGRYMVGEYKDFGHKSTNGQYKHSKQHQGQIIYFDKQDRPKVQPVYAHQSLEAVQQKLKHGGYKLYNDGMLFYSGAKVVVSNEFEINGKKNKSGPYKIGSVESSGSVKLRNDVGEEIRPNIKCLVEAGFILAAYHDKTESLALNT